MTYNFARDLLGGGYRQQLMALGALALGRARRREIVRGTVPMCTRPGASRLFEPVLRAA